MKFRITSVADESCGAKINDVTVKLEDWLNAAVADADFGGSLDQFMIVVIAVDDDLECNSRYAKPWNKLSNFVNPLSGQKIKSLCVSVEILPSYAAEVTFVELLRHIAQATQRRISIRPKRVPSGFDYPRASRATVLALDVFA